VGDGLMALFGAPLKLDAEEQALGAVRAGQVMQAKPPELNARWRKLSAHYPVTTYSPAPNPPGKRGPD
jgi:hypothetical protein